MPSSRIQSDYDAKRDPLTNQRNEIRRRVKRWQLRYHHARPVQIGRANVANVRALVARLPLVRQLRCAQLRRLRPLGNGRQRGLPIVRYYWAQFLEGHRADFRGRGLEIGTTETIRRYGG